jgi:transporter family protein
MQNWVWMAIASMCFAGLTSVVAKFGLKEVSADVGIAVRTAWVFLFILVNLFAFGKGKELPALTSKTILILGLSGLTTALSWIFYYKAIKIGPVSQVALIDKGSIIITLLLSFTILQEPITLKTAIGAGIILVGLGVLLWR